MSPSTEVWHFDPIEGVISDENAAPIATIRPFTASDRECRNAAMCDGALLAAAPALARLVSTLGEFHGTHDPLKCSTCADLHAVDLALRCAADDRRDPAVTAKLAGTVICNGVTGPVLGR